MASLAEGGGATITFSPPSLPPVGAGTAVGLAENREILVIW